MRWWPRSTGPGSNPAENMGVGLSFRDAAGKSQDATGADETVCSLVGSDGNSVNSSIISMNRQGRVSSSSLAKPRLGRVAFLQQAPFLIRLRA
jgi:hypothetical protein